MEAAAVHAFDQDHMPAGIHDRAGDRDPGLAGQCPRAVAMIFFAP